LQRSVNERDEGNTRRIGAEGPPTHLEQMESVCGEQFQLKRIPSTFRSDRE